MQFLSIGRSLNLSSGLNIAVLMAAMLVSGCDRLSVKDTLEGVNIALTDQFNHDVVFPKAYTENVMLVGYVYTHCPDICPIITINMRDVQRELAEENEFILVSISFDPDRDTPEVLNDYAERYRLNQENWRLLTGDKREVETLLEKLKIVTVKTPTRFTDENRPIYFIDHTDRVTLIDKKGQIRRTYTGSEFNYGEIADDVRLLLSER